MPGKTNFFDKQGNHYGVLELNNSVESETLVNVRACFILPRISSWQLPIHPEGWNASIQKTRGICKSQPMCNASVWKP